MGVNSLPWSYSETLGAPHEIISLAGDEWHHCTHVLRMAPGDRLILFDGQGHCFEGIIRQSGKTEGSIELLVERTRDFHSASSCRINIAFAPTKKMDRSEFAVEKVVELGVDAIWFLTCRHSERVTLRLDRMQKLVVSAAKQSRKLVLPTLQDLMSPIDCIRQFRHHHPNGIILCCHLDETSRMLNHTYHGEDDVLLLVGPEGGFSPEEINTFKTMGIEMVSLGPYRLRVETAVIAACANIQILHALNATS